MPSSIVVGIDQSSAGTAAVALEMDTGFLKGKMFFVPTKRDATDMRDEGAILSPKVAAGDEPGRVARLANLRDKLVSFLISQNPSHVACEDYALARQAHVHGLGEVGGVVRLLCWDYQIPLRLYDVQALKIFATGKGNAQKAEMVAAVAHDYLDFSNYGKAPKFEDAAGNLTDAYVIAQMLRTELLLRSGVYTLQQLPENHRRVYQRTTKQHPVNLLDTNFVLAQSEAQI